MSEIEPIKCNRCYRHKDEPREPKPSERWAVNEDWSWTCPACITAEEHLAGARRFRAFAAQLREDGQRSLEASMSEADKLERFADEAERDLREDVERISGAVGFK